jgi:hypothetical protein
MNAINYLGFYYGEKELELLFTELAIKAAPKIKRDEITTHSVSKELGVVLTFRRERFLDVQLREYPEGALVLSNILFYGVKNPTCKVWKGKLPYDVTFGQNKDALIKRLGVPEIDDSEMNIMRWDKEGHAVFADMNDDLALEIFSVQLPVA